MGDIKDSICRVPDTPYDGMLCYVFLCKFVFLQSFRVV